MALLDEYIADAVRYEQGYQDPELWLRLEPKLLEHVLASIRAVLGPGVPDYATYRERLGYLRGLEWVINEAQHLTRREAPNNSKDN